MNFSNERGSVIDAQITLQKEIQSELDRCKDWKYFYITYYRIVKENGVLIKPTLTKTQEEFIDIIDRKGYHRLRGVKITRRHKYHNA